MRDEQRLWEWCGLVQDAWGNISVPNNEPDTVEFLEFQEWPDITLDNLFRYAVPKVHHGLGITVSLMSGGGDTVGYPVVEMRKGGKRVVPLEMDDKDPAKTLFKAILRVIDNES